MGDYVRSKLFYKGRPSSKLESLKKDAFSHLGPWCTKYLSSELGLVYRLGFKDRKNSQNTHTRYVEILATMFVKKGRFLLMPYEERYIKLAMHALAREQLTTGAASVFFINPPNSMLGELEDLIADLEPPGKPHP